MSTVKWIGYIMASLVVLSVVLGIGLMVASLAAIFGIFFSVMALVCFVAFGIKDYFESKSEPRDPV